MPSATTSDYLYTAQMNNLLKLTPFNPPSTLYVALFTSEPTLASSGGAEVVNGVGYARVAIPSTGASWAGPSVPNLDFSNANEVLFGTPTANWGTIVAAGLFDAASSGNMLYKARLTTSKVVSNGDGAPKILAGQLRISRATC